MKEAELVTLFGKISPETSVDPVFQPRLREEDGSVYEGVWDVFAGGKRFILKKAKECEAEIYKSFLTPPRVFAPALLGFASADDGEYLLLEYVEGNNLQRASLRGIRLAVDALAQMQNTFWECRDASEIGLSFSESFSQKKKRRAYLGSALLERQYDRYLEAYEKLPRTLSHDDLLPFNVLISKERAVLIDWEAGGILPYPVSLARLVAHGRSHGQFFRMTPDQRRYAAERYYELVAARYGISREQFGSALSLFLFAETCEWVYLGNKYPNEPCKYYISYLRMANRMARALERGEKLI